MLKYHEILPLDQETLNISNKTRSNIFSWRGQFSPQLIEALISKYVPDNSLILDPFVGSGTVLCEAGHMKLKAVGCEINPSAFNMAQVYRFINKRRDERNSILDHVEEVLKSNVKSPLPLFSKSTNAIEISDRNKLRLTLNELESPDCYNLFETLIVLLDLYNNDPTPLKIFSKWNNLKQIVRNLPYSDRMIDVYLCDARELSLDSNVVDFVITSPPYINVFNYHQQYRSSAEFIGWDLLKVAESEIGSNRKHRQNRFLTVVQYCLDMFGVFRELKRVCKPGSQIVFIVGRESNVKKTKFFNGEIISMLAVKSIGLELKLKQERVFKNKFGKLIYEDILHFQNTPFELGEKSLSPRTIAKTLLEDAISRAPAESLNDLKIAINTVNSVLPSPIFEYNLSYSNSVP